MYKSIPALDILQPVGFVGQTSMVKESSSLLGTDKFLFIPLQAQAPSGKPWWRREWIGGGPVPSILLSFHLNLMYLAINRHGIARHQTLASLLGLHLKIKDGEGREAFRRNAFDFAYLPGHLDAL